MRIFILKIIIRFGRTGIYQMQELARLVNDEVHDRYKCWVIRTKLELQRLQEYRVGEHFPPDKVHGDRGVC